MISTSTTPEGSTGEVNPADAGELDSDPAAELSRLCGIAESLTGSRDAAQQALRSAINWLASSGRGSSRELRLLVAKEALRLSPPLGPARANGKVSPLEGLLPEFGLDGSLVSPAVEHSAASPAQVREAIQSLPELHRRALLLRDAHGFAVGEAASLLELEAPEVSRVVHRARQALQALLAASTRAF